jgi:hypothetical protein
VDSRGGWVQLNVRLSSAWEVGGGWGLDDPDDADLPTSGRLKNSAAEGHLHWRPGGGLLLGFEARRIETTYAGAREQAWHVNGFAGVAF